ncbi:MAG: hypothetical protein H0W23_04905 [Chloroflexia bacterium]|nr:hypothetical protein [Chloroflexia bacterium]
MLVTYTANRESHAFETEQQEDLREMAQEIERYLRAQHPDLDADGRLPIVVADGLLNGLAEEVADEVALGVIDQQA